jgi:hypothetical protein
MHFWSHTQIRSSQISNDLTAMTGISQDFGTIWELVTSKSALNVAPLKIDRQLPCAPYCKITRLPQVFFRGPTFALKEFPVDFRASEADSSQTKLNIWNNLEL